MMMSHSIISGRGFGCSTILIVCGIFKHKYIYDYILLITLYLCVSQNHIESLYRISIIILICHFYYKHVNCKYRTRNEDEWRGT